MYNIKRKYITFISPTVGKVTNVNVYMYIYTILLLTYSINECIYLL